jgi:membrane protein YdbS with pleckstrin-like domain
MTQSAAELVELEFRPPTWAVFVTETIRFGAVQILIYYLFPSLSPSTAFMVCLVPTLVAIVAYEARRHSLRLEADRVVIRHGFMGWTTSTVDFADVQAVWCRRDPIDRPLGIGVLKIQSKSGKTVKAKWIADPERIVALIEQRRR